MPSVARSAHPRDCSGGLLQPAASDARDHCCGYDTLGGPNVEAHDVDAWGGTRQRRSTAEREAARMSAAGGHHHTGGGIEHRSGCGGTAQEPDPPDRRRVLTVNAEAAFDTASLSTPARRVLGRRSDATRDGPTVIDTRPARRPVSTACGAVATVTVLVEETAGDAAADATETLEGRLHAAVSRTSETSPDVTASDSGEDSHQRTTKRTASSSTPDGPSAADSAPDSDES